jgi:hypothetical protein
MSNRTEQPSPPAPLPTNLRSVPGEGRFPRRALNVRLVLLVAAALELAAPLHVTMAAESEKTPVLTVLRQTAEPLLKADRPWESMGILLDQVLKIGDQWHMWYAAFDHDYRDDNDCHFCYARSKDGVHWEKPSLGIYSYKGNTANNVLLSGFNFCSFIFDENALPAERFRAVGASQRKTGGTPTVNGMGWWIYGATSPDGLRWKVVDEPLLKKNSDSANICIRDGNVYRLYVRMWSGGDFAGVRTVGYSESPTFGNFPDPVEILRADPSDQMQFYDAATSKISNNLYLMFPSGYFPKDGTVQVYAAFGRDGKRFRQLGRAPLLQRGKGFDKMGIYVGAGATPSEQPGTYWVYYAGTSVSHEATVAEHHYNGGVGRFLVKIDD